MFTARCSELAGASVVHREGRGPGGRDLGSNPHFLLPVVTHLPEVRAPVFHPGNMGMCSGAP